MLPLEEYVLGSLGEGTGFGEDGVGGDGGEGEECGDCCVGGGGDGDGVPCYVAAGEVADQQEVWW